MKVKIEVLNGYIRTYSGMFIKKERDLIDAEFDRLNKIKPIKDGKHIIEVKELSYNG